MAKTVFGNVYMLRSVDIINEINIHFINWRSNVLFVVTHSEPVSVATYQSLFFCLRFIAVL